MIPETLTRKSLKIKKRTFNSYQLNTISDLINLEVIFLVPMGPQGKRCLGCEKRVEYIGNLAQPPDSNGWWPWSPHMAWTGSRETCTAEECNAMSPLRRLLTSAAQDRVPTLVVRVAPRFLSAEVTVIFLGC
jgi:hypothetical protein